MHDMTRIPMSERSFRRTNIYSEKVTRSTCAAVGWSSSSRTVSPHVVFENVAVGSTDGRKLSRADISRGGAVARHAALWNE